MCQEMTSVLKNSKILPIKHSFLFMQQMNYSNRYSDKVILPNLILYKSNLICVLKNLSEKIDLSKNLLSHRFCQCFIQCEFKLFEELLAKIDRQFFINFV